jgi:hypothetical protein
LPQHTECCQRDDQAMSHAVTLPGLEPADIPGSRCCVLVEQLD